MTAGDTLRSARVLLRRTARATVRLGRRISAWTGRSLARARGVARRLRDGVTETFKVERLTLYDFPLVDPDSTRGADDVNSGFHLIHADVDNIGRMKQQHPREFTDRKHDILRDRLDDKSEECYLVEDREGNLCGYCHVAPRNTLNARINYAVRLGPSDVYFFDDHTFRTHRRRGVHTFTIAERARLMHRRGFVTGVTIISDGNAPSIGSYERFGARRQRLLFHLTKLNRTFSCSTTILPWRRRET